MKKRYIFLLAVAGLVIVLDQIVKVYIHTQFHLGESVTIISNFFNITYVRNPGAAFGFLASAHPAFRELFFLSMPPLALLIILMILRGVEDDDYLQVISLSCVFGGAIGNYIDRVRLSYVIDFLDFHIYEKYTWPAFNIADMAIVCGVSVLLVLMFREPKKAGSVPA
jgi:signal peptidase II